jgi:small conductance mechanosensitive channel
MVLTVMTAPMALAQRLTDQGRSTVTESSSGVTSFFSTLWTKAPGWIAAMIVFACSFVFANMMKNKVVDRVSEKLEDEDKDVLVLIGRATYMGVLAVGITISLKIAGIDLTAIIAAIGFGIGFALQDLMMNFLSGILILVNRQFTIGDFIKVNGTIGQVMEIQSRATILKALDGTRVIVPNADLFKNEVISFTSNDTRRIEVAVGVAYRTDLAHASQIILESLKDNAGVLNEPVPAILLNEFSDNSINFLVRFWVDSHAKWLNTKSEVIHSIKQHFDAEGIEIPFPIRTLVFDKDTEDVMIPTYQAASAELNSKQAQRESEQTELATKIAAAAERAQIMRDIQPPPPPEKIEEKTGAALLAEVEGPSPLNSFLEEEEEEIPTPAAIEQGAELPAAAAA